MQLYISCKKLLCSRYYLCTQTFFSMQTMYTLCTTYRRSRTNVINRDEPFAFLPSPLQTTHVYCIFCLLQCAYITHTFVLMWVAILPKNSTFISRFKPTVHVVTLYKSYALIKWKITVYFSLFLFIFFQQCPSIIGKMA